MDDMRDLIVKIKSMLKLGLRSTEVNIEGKTYYLRFEYDSELRANYVVVAYELPKNCFVEFDDGSAQNRTYGTMSGIRIYLETL